MYEIYIKNYTVVCKATDFSCLTHKAMTVLNIFLSKMLKN
jgi:hypothetical protein